MWPQMICLWRFISRCLWADRFCSKGLRVLAKPTSPARLRGPTDTRLIRLQCYEGLDAAQAIYEWNYQRQLLAIRAAAEDGETGKTIEARLFSEEYLLQRPLLQAIRQEVPQCC